jgi:D-sedoheptulose 7-phosphate isomerase
MEILQQVFNRHKDLVYLEEPIKNAVKALADVFRNGGKLLICGNGGSSSDADHIVGELMKGFEKPRPLQAEVKQKLIAAFGERGKILAENLQQGLPAISLSAHSSLLTAISNDLGGDYIFAQQVAGYGKAGDALLAISTSGNSRNVVDALIMARATGLFTIGITGENNGKINNLCDVLISLPETRTAYTQELHLPVYHAICLMVEKDLFG